MVSFTAQHSRHIMLIENILETFPRGRPTWADTTIMLLYDPCMIRDWWSNAQITSNNSLKTVQKHFSYEMKWNTFLHWRHAFTPKDFEMHQQSLDHSYCKRETSLTKLKNYKSVMILVVRFSSSPIQIYHLGNASASLQTVTSPWPENISLIWHYNLPIYGTCSKAELQSFYGIPVPWLDSSGNSWF
jgi:hypothetical protein